MIRFKFTVINGPSKGTDPLGGTVTQDNAALTMMSAHVSGPELDAMKVGESQVREATTADGYYYPDTRGTRGSRASHRQRIRYHIERVS